MKLSRLELFGFKSFPQRTDIRFEDGITGIVGPNGSGKSNIADAVRWVLGEQSAKALRGAKMEDVIFAGTQKRRLMPYCEVSLVFDNQDGMLRSEHTEVMVTRRVYRSGESEYSLNKKNCRLKDIVELFHDTGIGREGYSIIGQGHIDMILSGRGEDRRAAFEEAAGIIGFRSRKEEAQRKLNRTQDHLNRVSDLLNELESRLEPLADQAQTARQYLEMASRLKHLDANIFLSRHERLGKRIDQLKENIAVIAQQIANHERDIANSQSKRKQAEEEISRLDDENQAARAELNLRESKLRDHLVLLERKRQNLLSLSQELERTMEAKQQDALQEQELAGLLTTGQQASQGQSGLLLHAQQQLQDLEKEHEHLQTLLQQAEEELEQNRERMLKAANSRSDSRERRARQQAMLGQAENRLKEVKQGEAGLQADLQAAKDQFEACQKSLQQAMEVSSQAQQQEEEAKLNNERAMQEVAKVANEIRGLQAELQRDVGRLNALRDVERGHEGYYQPVQKALNYAKGNSKVKGAVAQLIKVPQEYETAIEMALGGALQNIVTSDEETAKELIEYLRENRLGRTTFLPLNAVSGRSLNHSERDVLRLPGCLGVASELIGYSEEYRGIMESLLGRTVVTKDLDSAIAVSRRGRQSFHVVTLKGDVMRAGGAMTGGSIASRTVSLLGRQREINELDTRCKEAQERLSSLMALEETAQAHYDQTNSLLTEKRATAQDEGINLAREEEHADKASERLQLIESNLSQSRDAIVQLEEAIDSLKKDLSLSEKQGEEIESDRVLLEEKDTALRNAFQMAREAAETKRAQLDSQRATYQEMTHQMEILKRDAVRLEKEKLALQNAMEKNHQKIEHLNNKKQAEQAELTQMEAEEKSLQTALDDTREQFNKTEDIRRDLVKQQNRFIQEGEAAHERHDEDSTRQHKSELSLTRLEEELQNLGETLWNNHELTYALAEELKEQGRFELPQAEREASEIRTRIKELGAINIHAMDEYTATKERFDGLSAQKEDAEKAMSDLGDLIKRLQSEMEKQFLREFEKLNAYFEETFKRLFAGGQASLTLEDPTNPLDCEINIKAQPPGKKLQLLSLLSGGERALTAIAMMFAMLKLKPTPFCILDEIEAALDDANIQSFGDYLAEYKADTQFIVITHRKGTMERCDSLYGVTMREKGVSDLISVSLQEYSA